MKLMKGAGHKRDIGKWPVTIAHQQARDKKRSDEQASAETELIPGPYDNYD